MAASVDGPDHAAGDGAAAFLMVEYVGIPTPRCSSTPAARGDLYIALFYIVHPRP